MSNVPKDRVDVENTQKIDAHKDTVCLYMVNRTTLEGESVYTIQNE